MNISNKSYVVGSSKNRTCGLSNISNAIDNLFFCPPDKLEHFVVLVCDRWSSSKMLSICNIRFSLLKESQ